MDIIQKLKDKAKTPEQKMAINNCIFLFITGSHLYGTNTENSDIDYEGVFLEDEDYILGTKQIEEVDLSTKSSADNRRNTKDDIDCKLYSLRKFIRLATLNNPNKIEWFFVPEDKVVIKTPQWDYFISNNRVNDFLSQRIKHTFGGYAFAQKSNLLTKKKRLDSFREYLLLLQLVDKMGGTTVGDLAMYVHLINPEIKKAIGFKSLYDKESGGECMIICEKKYNHGTSLSQLIDQCQAEINRYGHRTALLDNSGFDTKFASHVFRLLYEAIELLTTQNLTYPLKQADFIKYVKLGKLSFDEVIDQIDKLDSQLEQAFQSTKLQHTPDLIKINDIQKEIYREVINKY